MSLKQKRILCVVVVIAGFLLMVLGLPTVGWLSCTGAAISVGGVILDCVLVRCANCGTWVGKIPGEYCKICGKKIDWEGKKEN